MSRLIIAAVVAFIVISLVSVTPANAGPIVMVRDEAGGSGYYRTGTTSRLHATLDGSSFTSLYSGTFAFEADYGAGWTPLTTYCIDPYQPVRFANFPQDRAGWPYDLVALDALDGITTPERDQLELLWENALASSLTDRVHAAAFQVIIWELKIDDALDLASGDFRLDTSRQYEADVASVAQPWIDELAAPSTWTKRAPLWGLYSEASQDFITPIPEPATLLLLIGGTFLLLFLPR